MNVLKSVLTCCSLSVAMSAGMVHAQGAEPEQAAQSASQQQVAQANIAHHDGAIAPRRAAVRPVTKTEECVGPVSFCNIFFGS